MSYKFKNETYSLGIIDSGIGGLTLVNTLQQIHPKTQIDSICDSKNVPFGNMGPELLWSKLLKMTKILVERGNHFILVGCNTLTVELISRLRDNFPQQQFIGIEPYFNWVNHHPVIQKDIKLAMLLTPNTAKAERTLHLKETFDPEGLIRTFPMPDLATDIEEFARTKRPIVLEKIEKQLEFLSQEKFQHCLLGCTHYSWIRPILEKQGLVCIEANEAVSRRVWQLLKRPKISEDWLNISLDEGESWLARPQEFYQNLLRTFTLRPSQTE